MSCYVIIPSQSIQIFNREWTSTNAIISDLEMLREWGFPLEFGNVIICTKHSQLMLRPDLEFDYFTRHIYASTDFGSTFVVGRNDIPRYVRTDDELKEILGYDINA